MLALLVAATLAQTSAPAPDVAVFLRPGPGGLKPSLRESVLTSVATVLAEAGFPVSVDAREADNRLRRANAEACNTRVECLFRIARALEVDILVAVEATDFEGDVAVALEVVAPEGERHLARFSAVVRSVEVGWRLRGQLGPFARELRSSMGTNPVDAPLAVKEPPAVEKPQLAVTPPAPSALEFPPRPPPGRSRVPAYVAAGGAAVAAGAAIVFGVRRAGICGSRAVLCDFEAQAGTQEAAASDVTIPEALQASQAADQNLAASLVSIGVSAGLTGLAALLWPREQP
ncbi:MAG TPA: hypothetical protein VE549_09160 [Myxococcaceae bacterium]|nr:hypothetical protein [Myxococcaceae bacterium]